MSDCFLRDGICFSRFHFQFYFILSFPLGSLKKQILVHAVAFTNGEILVPIAKFTLLS